MSTLSIFSRCAVSFSFAACALVASGQTEETIVEESVIDSTGKEVTGFNALEYVLQKPNHNQYFESKSFGDRLFLSVEAGPGWLHNPGNRFNFPSTDVQLGISAGDWVTPVHGWRVGLNGGIHNINSKRPFYIGLSADYLANLTALVRGDNPDRKFEVIGSAGLEYQFLHHSNDNSNLFGARLGLQFRANISKSTFVYIEPRAGIYFGDAIDRNSSFRYRVEPSILFGLGYRWLSGEERKKASERFISRGFEDNMFYELSGGWTGLKSRNGKRGIFTDRNMSAKFAVGKWFSSASALRITGSYGKIDYGQSFIMTDLDWVWNISSALTGFRRSDLFELDLSAGVSGIYVSHAKAKFYPGIKAGLQGTFNVTPNWGIFIQPEMHMFGRGYPSDMGKQKVLTSLHAGVRYTIGNYKYDYDQNLETFRNPEEKKNFVSVAGGPAKYNNGYGFGGAVQLGFGRWFSPMSAWRVTVDAQTFPRTNYDLRNISLGADYILSLSSALSGYNPDRIFDFSGSVGVYGGLNHIKNPYTDKSITRPMATFKASFLWSLRLAKSWRAVVETQALASSIPVSDSEYQLRPEIRLLLGLQYSF